MFHLIQFVMKKISTVLLLTMAFFGLNAQVFTENFEDAVAGSDLEGYNEWFVSAKAGDALGASPVIAEGSLNYPGYIGAGVGHVAVLDPAVGDDASTQRISTRLVTFGEDPLQNVVGDKIYAAFLVNVSDASKTGTLRDFFTFEGSATSSMTRGRVFARVTSEGVLNFGISKNTGTASAIVESAPELYCDVDYLLVMVYEGIEGDNNDVVSLYINPDLTKSEAEQSNVITATDAASDYSSTAKLGINLRQRAIGARIGGIRVAKTWDAALLNTPVGLNSVEAEKPSLAVYATGSSVYTSESGHLEIFSITGKRVFAGFSNGQVDSALNKGLYIVKMISESGQIYSEKVVIE